MSNNGRPFLSSFVDYLLEGRWVSLRSPGAVTFHCSLFNPLLTKVLSSSQCLFRPDSLVWARRVVYSCRDWWFWDRAELVKAVAPCLKRHSHGWEKAAPWPVGAVTGGLKGEEGALGVPQNSITCKSK